MTRPLFLVWNRGGPNNKPSLQVHQASHSTGFLSSDDLPLSLRAFRIPGHRANVRIVLGTEPLQAVPDDGDTPKFESFPNVFFCGGPGGRRPGICKTD